MANFFRTFFHDDFEAVAMIIPQGFADAQKPEDTPDLVELQISFFPADESCFPVMRFGFLSEPNGRHRAKQFLEYLEVDTLYTQLKNIQEGNTDIDVDWFNEKET